MTTLNLSRLNMHENKRFSQCAKEVRQLYNEIIESISMPHVQNIHWILGNLASRNKYTSPLYIRLCFIAFVEAEISQNPKIHTIILSDRPLATWFSDYFKKQKKSVKVCCTEGIVAYLWRIQRPFRQFILGFAYLFLRYLGRSTRFSYQLPSNQSITLIDTFVLNNATGDEGGISNGEYKDRYYPGLLDNLYEEEKKAIFFIPTIVGFKNPIKIFRQIRSLGKQFIIHDDFLKFTDYVYALLQPFCLLKCGIPKTLFRGKDITSLLYQEHIEKCSEHISLLGMLYYRFTYRLSERGINVRLFVDWNENQSIDKGMIVGFHQFHSKTRVIGYQGYIIAKDMHLYVYPNKTEWLGKAIPDVLYVIGESLKEDMREFCSEINVAVAPAFRFQKLWRERNFYPDEGFYTVLVGLPIGLDDTAHILQLLVDVLPSLDRKIRFWIKPHPTWSPEAIRPLLTSTWPVRFRFKIGSFHDILEGANLLITNASSVSLEALAKGVPVIIIGERTGISQNPIPATVAQDYWKIVYSSEQCVEVIQQFYAMVRNEIIPKTYYENLKKNFFELVSRQSVLRFLEYES